MTPYCHGVRPRTPCATESAIVPNVEVSKVDGAKRTNGSRPRIEALATLVTIVGSLAVFVLALGGGLMWLRFHHIGLPATAATAAVPRETLASVALTELA